jgi:hypothetical protein
MIVWAPTPRTAATTAVVRLLQRPEWRDSPAGDQLRTRLRSLMDDEDPVVRMLALEGLRFAGPDHVLQDAQLLAVAIDRLRRESHPHPRSMLLNWFSHLLDADPGTADAYLAEDATGSGAPLTDADPGGSRPDDDEAFELLVAAVVHLAVVHDTPTARELVFWWGSEPFKHQTRVEQMLWAIRDYLRPFSAPVQERAFALLSTTARLVADEYLRQRKGYELAPLPEVADRLHGAGRLAHNIAQQVYFASGAFDATQQPATTTPLTADQLAAFAAHARPLLCDLARVDHPQVVHPIVETLIHLVEVDPGGVFHDIAQAVPGRTAYVTDRMAADELTTFLQYMLANHRGVVLGAKATLEDFRTLLEKLAWAGQPSAVELAYNFSDIFV